jgi:uncharacterized membrane protein YphA (DoxX/SURF4 family)
MITDQIQKLAFIIVCFIIISGNSVTHILSCQTQKFLRDNIYIKHVIGFLLIFIFIMLEGGWSLDDELQNRESVNWTNGNSFDTLFFSFILYSLFILMSKMKLVANMTLIFILLTIYILNSQREFLYKRNVIHYKDNIVYSNYIYGLTFIALLVCIFGVYEYYRYQKLEYGDKFSALLFWFSTKTCYKLE